MTPTKFKLLVKLEPELIKEGETPKGNKPLRAKVLAVGSSVKDIKEGQYVVFAPFGFDEVDENVIISEELILATYEEEKDK
jgi:hypothetical protein